MDFSKITYGERIIDILDPLHDCPSGIKLTIVCSEDKNVQKLLRKFIDEQNRYAAKGKTMPDEVTSEYDVKLIQTSITSWQWGKHPKTKQEATWRGEKPDLNPKNLKDILENFPTFKRQVLEEIKEDKDFLQLLK